MDYKTAEEKRTIGVCVLFNQKEHKLLKECAAAEGLPMATYIRLKALCQKKKRS